jgi:hypothetical protein
MKALRPRAPRHTSHSRDAALRRLRSTNRWLIAGSALLTGLFTEFAASAFSGHASTVGAARHAGHHHAQAKQLKPPAQPPAPAAAAPSEAPSAGAPSEAPAEVQHEPSEPSEPAPEAAPERQEPEVHEAAPPPASEPSEPVVSGGS